MALKLLYGLDGRQPQVLPPGVAAPPDWQAWAAAAYERIADPCDFPLSPEQVGIGPFFWHQHLLLSFNSCLQRLLMYGSCGWGEQVDTALDAM